MKDNPPLLPDLFKEHILNEEFINEMNTKIDNGVEYSKPIQSRFISSINKKTGYTLDQLLPKGVRKLPVPSPAEVWKSDTLYRVHDTLNGTHFDFADKKPAEEKRNGIQFKHREKFNYLAKWTGYPTFVGLNNFEEGKFLIENIEFGSLYSTMSSFHIEMRQGGEWKEFRHATYEYGTTNNRTVYSNNGSITIVQSKSLDNNEIFDIENKVRKEYTKSLYQALLDISGDDEDLVSLTLAANMVDTETIASDAVGEIKKIYENKKDKDQEF